MVKKQSKAITKDRASKRIRREAETLSEINASELCGNCTERLRAFGGLLGLIKFLGLLRLTVVFDYF